MIARGIRDVKQIGLWNRLAKHLVGMTFKAYNGHYRVPPDRHLADAIYTVAENKRGEVGLYCDVVFFTVAMRRETTRLGRYYELGYIEEEPENLRELYASTVAHELGHCQKGGHGEKIAEKWEKRARVRLRKEG